MSSEQAVARAQSNLTAHKSDIRAASGDTYAVKRVIRDRNGTSHVRYTRTYRGVTVMGGDFVIHNAPDGRFAGSSAGQPAPLSLSTAPKVPAADATASARKAFTGTVSAVGTPQLRIDATGASGRLVWESVVEGMQSDGQTPSKLHVITDATTGAVVGTQDEVRSVTGTGNSRYSGTVQLDTTQSGGTYQLRDSRHTGGTTCDMKNATSGTCTVFTDADNTWGTGAPSDRQTAAVDAHYGAAVTFDYFRTAFGRNGVLGNGAGVPSRVHYGNNYANAFWNGSQMTYGDGSGNAKPLVSLDVAAHEMSHGVTEATANLAYSGESGGLNEATSDIFAAMVEFYANNGSDPGDYDIGEKLDLRGNGKPLRYMYNPPLDGASDGCWSSSTAGKNVHYSSGVGNHFFFLLAEGSGTTAYGTSPVCNNAPAVTGIGRTDAAAVWYRALDAYFTSSTRYKDTSAANNDARNYTLKAATDLFGSCSRQYRAVQAAWTAVNVAGEDATCTGSPATSTTTARPTTTSGTTRPPATQPTTATTTRPGTTTPATSTTSGTTSAPAASTPATTTPTGTTPTGTTPTRTTSGSGTTAPAPSTCGPVKSSAQVPIPDAGAAVTSAVAISGCDRKASATTKVRVDVTHPFRGDLVITLVAPDGTAYRLKNPNGRDGVDDIHSVFAVNASPETANGTWTLRVQDVYRADRGTLTGWTLTL